MSDDFDIATAFAHTVDRIKQDAAAAAKMPRPRTPEEIIRAGDLDTAGIRELRDIAREIGLRDVLPDSRWGLLQAIGRVARARGWGRSGRTA